MNPTNTNQPLKTNDLTVELLNGIENCKKGTGEIAKIEENVQKFAQIHLHISPLDQKEISELLKKLQSTDVIAREKCCTRLTDLINSIAAAAKKLPSPQPSAERDKLK